MRLPHFDCAPLHLSAALCRRGVDDAVAGLAAEIGMAAFGYAAKAWFDDSAPGLDAHLSRAFATLQQLAPVLGTPDPGFA